jgi:hypothetical protein
MKHYLQSIWAFRLEIAIAIQSGNWPDIHIILVNQKPEPSGFAPFFGFS